MKVKLIVIGKTDETAIQSLLDKYYGRIKTFLPFEIIIIPDIKNTKNLSESQQKNKEGEQILKNSTPADYVVLLDEKGREFTSKGFAGFIQKQMNAGLKNLIFIIGGPYGFSEAVYKRANQKLALSQMTFSHQLVRAIFLEQLYRALTILHNHPYHHE